MALLRAGFGPDLRIVDLHVLEALRVDHEVGHRAGVRTGIDRDDG